MIELPNPFAQKTVSVGLRESKYRSRTAFQAKVIAVLPGGFVFDEDGDDTFYPNDIIEFVTASHAPLE